MEEKCKLLNYNVKNFKLNLIIINKLIFIFLFFILLIHQKSKNNLLLNIKVPQQNYNFNNGFNNIPISYGLNNDNFYPTLTSIISILENSNNSTYYYFYILVSKNKKQFSQKNKIKFKSLEQKYSRCKVNIIEINDNIFRYVTTNRYPLPTYYRLLLAELLPFLNRIIYLDGDTIVLTDLTDLINLNMENNIIMGFIDDGYNYTNFFGIKTSKYITAGVLLINLESMKKENITFKFFQFIQKNQKFLIQEDQTVINIVLHERIGILPPKYGLWSFSNISDLLFHNHFQNYFKDLKCYNDEELINAWKYPGIIHYVVNKPYLFDNYQLNTTYINYWLYYAKKTGEFDNIIKYYKFSL